MRFIHIKTITWFGTILFAFSFPYSVGQEIRETDTTARLKSNPATADHSKFEILKQDFETGPEVTAACLTCHTEAAKQIHQTIHWNWFNPKLGLGKRNVVNNFCISVGTNEPRCTSCHVGYGWNDASFDFQSEERVDCLVCHDTTGTYHKFPTDAGHPNYLPKEWPKGSGKMVAVPDLSHVAQNVGQASRQTCGSCHFYGGGGDGVKHGHLDSSLTNPTRDLDVHMAVDGLNFECTSCHSTWGHQVAGSKYQLKAADPKGMDLPRMDHDRASCVSCHGHAPMRDSKLNHHVRKIACETCHIPEFARGGVPTKMFWDWSTAFQRKGENGQPLKSEKNDDGEVTYINKKGSFEWGRHVVPSYMWFDGKMQFTKTNETTPIDMVDGQPQPLVLTRIKARPNQPGSRIWPFKIMRGVQPYDARLQQLALPHLFSKDKHNETAFWKNKDWQAALVHGMEHSNAYEQGAENRSFTGKLKWVETEMYWPITHMVAPKEQALTCANCHSEDSRMAGLEGIYVPGLHQHTAISGIGWSMALLSLLGVIAHGLVRFIRK